MRIVIDFREDRDIAIEMVNKCMVDEMLLRADTDCQHCDGSEDKFDNNCIVCAGTGYYPGHQHIRSLPLNWCIEFLRDLKKQDGTPQYESIM